MRETLNNIGRELTWLTWPKENLNFISQGCWSHYKCRGSYLAREQMELRKLARKGRADPEKLIQLLRVEFGKSGALHTVYTVSLL